MCSRRFRLRRAAVAWICPHCVRARFADGIDERHADAFAIQPGAPVRTDLGDVSFVINGANLGDIIHLGHTTDYSADVHYDAQGTS